MTACRIAVCAAVKNSERHMTAREIAAEVKKKLGHVSTATVYNNLNALVSEGVIGRFTVDGRTDLYDRFPFSHAHLVCDSCGKITDARVPSLAEFLSEKTEKEIKGYTLFLRYTCEECEKKK